ncbi:MAG: E3 binding domain-containing protein [Micromonosporaceae bacterium]
MGGDIRATPLVRRLADEYGVNLAAVRATGVGGRIRKDDVMLAAVQLGRAAIAAQADEYRHLFPPVEAADPEPREYRHLFPDRGDEA